MLFSSPAVRSRSPQTPRTTRYPVIPRLAVFVLSVLVSTVSVGWVVIAVMVTAVPALAVAQQQPPPTPIGPAAGSSAGGGGPERASQQGGPGIPDTEAASATLAVLLAKISVYWGSEMFTSDVADFNRLALGVNIDKDFLTYDLLIPVIEQRAVPAMEALRRRGLATAEAEECLRPFTAEEKAGITDTSDTLHDIIDPAPYERLLRQLLTEIRNRPPPPGTPGITRPAVPDDDVEAALVGFDLAKFMAGGAGMPGGVSVPGGDTPLSPSASVPAGPTGSVVSPSSQMPTPSTGVPPVALFGAGAGVVLAVATPIVLVGRRRRRSAAIDGGRRDTLLRIGQRLVQADRLEELQRVAIEELGVLVSADTVHWIAVADDGSVEPPPDWPTADGTGAPSSGYADTVPAIVAAAEWALARANHVDRTDLADRTADGGNPVTEGPPLGNGSGPSVLPVAVRQGDRTVAVLVAVRSPAARFTSSDTAVARSFADLVDSALTGVARLSSFERMALVDPLTSLANRRCFDRDMADAFASVAESSAEVCLVIVDVDHFKSVNDRFGHGVGDEVLKAVAAELSIGLRGVDHAYRVGGEEFAVVLQGESARPDNATRVVERLRLEIEALDLTEAAGGQRLRVTASFGVAIVTGGSSGANAAALQERADVALYAAKGAGRNRWVVASPG